MIHFKILTVMDMRFAIGCLMLVFSTGIGCKKDEVEKLPQGERVFTIEGTLLARGASQPLSYSGVALTQWYTAGGDDPTAITDSTGNFTLVHGWSTKEKSLKLHLIDPSGCYAGSFDLLDDLSGGRNIQLGKLYVGY